MFRLARSVAALYRPAADLKGVELAIAGASSGEVWVNTDEVRLRQVLGNLVANAVKFTDHGEVVLTVRQDDGTPPGTVFIPFAYVEAAANLLTNAALDPFGKIPELKYCAVRVTGV